MIKRLLQVIVTIIGACGLAFCLLIVDWWLYIMTGKTLGKRFTDYIDNSKLRDYTL